MQLKYLMLTVLHKASAVERKRERERWHTLMHVWRDKYFKGHNLQGFQVEREYFQSYSLLVIKTGIQPASSAEYVTFLSMVESTGPSSLKPVLYISLLPARASGFWQLFNTQFTATTGNDF